MSNNDTSRAVVQIHGVELQRVEYQGEPVATFAQIDKAHKRPDDTAGRNFRSNRPRFVEGEDFFELTSDEIRRMCEEGVFPPRSSRGTLITRRGYLKLVKSLNDDVAWSVFDDMLDRYFAAEQRPVARLDDNAWLRQTLLGYTEKVTELQGVIAEAQPKLQALERIADSDGSFCITVAAKNLQARPKDLFAFLRGRKWIYSRAGGSEVAYQDKLQAGLLEHKTTTVHRSDGSEKAVTQVRVTPKGLTVLAQQFGAH